MDGNAVRTGIDVAILGVDATRGDEDIAAAINVALGGDGGVATRDGAELGLVDPADEFRHLTLPPVHLIVNRLLFCLLDPALLTPGLLLIPIALRTGGEILQLAVLAVDGLLDGLHAGSGFGANVEGVVFTVRALEAAEVDDGIVLGAQRRDEGDED